MMTDATQAIFSMSFFHYVPSAGGQEERWAVSPKLWVYWAVAIPLTIATVIAWYLWQNWSSRKAITLRPQKRGIA